ncbi:MAG TPA: DMT family transporter [Xanthobacteraceae bacterium]|nr:DMT family transporter [Xanthobacteraceae bacterium]
MPEDRDDSRQHGGLMILGSAAAFSAAGFCARLTAVDAWTTLFWRSLFGGLLIAGYIIWSQRGRVLTAFRSIGPTGCLIAGCATLGSICYINALRRTTVADVTLIYAAAPFLTAGIGWLRKGEPPSRSTLFASAVALVGVALMVCAAISSNHLAGNVLALIMTVVTAVMMVLIRRHRETPMLPASCLSAFAIAALMLPVARPLSPSAIEFVHLALFGAQFGLGLLLLTLGTRLISATRSALIGNLEIPLSPAWVWLAFNEVPPTATVIGGSLVVLAVAADVLLARTRL